MDARHRLIDEADREVLEEVVFRTDLIAIVLHVVVALQPVLEAMSVRRHDRQRILLEVKVEKPHARTDRPLVRHLVGEVRIDRKGHHRRVDRIEVQVPAVRILRAKSVLRHDAQAEGKVPRQWNCQMKVRQPEDARIHGRGPAARQVRLNPSARMLGHETRRHREIRQIRQRRRIEEVRRSVVGASNYSTA